MSDWGAGCEDGEGFGLPDRLTPGPSPAGERGDERGEGVAEVRLSWDVSMRGVSGRQRDNARVLRRHQTAAEETLWREIRGRKIEGLKFRRQVPVGRFIVDFLCFEAGMIIELDGVQHADVHVREYDDMRTRYLKEQGFEVLRFTNVDVESEMQTTLERIVRIARARRPPLSPEGEGPGVRR